MAKNKTLELSIKIAGKVDKSLMAAINQTNGMMFDLTKTMSRVGTVGLAAMGTLATGTVAALASCTKEAKTFEGSMANVVKYVDGLADKSGKISTDIAFNGITYEGNYAAMKGAILDLSTQIPYTAEELTELAAAAGQSGKDIDELIQFDKNGNVKGFLRDVAMVGTALDIDAKQAGDWAAKWEVALKMNHDEIMVLFDQINYLGANSATTAAEIANAVNSAASLGQIGGVDVATTVALADAMLATGVSTDRVGTSIKRMVTNISKGENATKAQKELWEELGFTATGVAASMQKDATGTLNAVFTAIQNMPKERQVAALSTLFGQWAIEGGAKIVNNLDAFTKALNMVGDPAQYTGSMNREFIIKSETSEALDQRMESAMKALKIDIGTAFLPAKKEMSVAMIDFMNRLRDTPELAKVAETLAGLFATGVEKVGDALEKAMPYIQQGLDYIANHGPEVVSILGKIAGAFALMKFSPGITSLLGGIGGAVFGSSTPAAQAGGKAGGRGGLLGGAISLFKGGQKTAEQAVRGGGSWLGAIRGAAQSQGLGTTLRATVSNLISRGKPNVTMNMLAGAASGQNNLSAVQGVGSAIAGRVRNSAVGRYAGSVGASVGNLGSSIANTTVGQRVTGGIGRLAAGAKTKVAGMGAAAVIRGNVMKDTIANSGVGRAVGGAIGRMKGGAGNLVSGIANSGVGRAVGGAMGQIGGVAKAGAGVLGSVFGPMAGGFASIVSGALPIVGVISAIIAVMSLLWDNVDALRGPIEAIFGAEGLAIFDSFKNGVDGVLGYIMDIFNGGLAGALSGVRDMFSNALGEGGFLSTLFGGQETGLAAFDGVVMVLQSILGVVGQVVTFANTTVKPIIMDIFTFLTGTVIPQIMQIIAAVAPTISSIITQVGGIIMRIAQGIGTVIQAVMPAIQGIIQTILNVASVVIPVLLNAIDAILPVVDGIIAVVVPIVTVAISTISGFLEGLFATVGNIVTGIANVFQGLIDFITGVFTGNWEQAWTGIKEIFGGIFDTLAALVKAPINAVIGIINGAIRGINSIGFDVPDWVPFIGGSSFRIDIPEIPLLAKGGFTTGPSIAGEAGKEAVISFQSGVRGDNIKTWMEAGRLLGVNGNQAATAAGLKAIDMANGRGKVELKDPNPPDDKKRDDRDGSGGGGMVFAPTVIVQGNADRAVIDEALQEAETRFRAWYEKMKRREERTRY